MVDFIISIHNEDILRQTDAWLNYSFSVHFEKFSMIAILTCTVISIMRAVFIFAWKWLGEIQNFNASYELNYQLWSKDRVSNFLLQLKASRLLLMSGKLALGKHKHLIFLFISKWVIKVEVKLACSLLCAQLLQRLWIFEFKSNLAWFSMAKA
jgi:hypothetical protein